MVDVALLNSSTVAFAQVLHNSRTLGEVNLSRCDISNISTTAIAGKLEVLHLKDYVMTKLTVRTFLRALLQIKWVA